MNVKKLDHCDFLAKPEPAYKRPLRISQKRLDNWERLKNMQTTPIYFDHKAFFEIFGPWFRNWR